MPSVSPARNGYPPVSSPSYEGRHRAPGQHRGPAKGPRIPEVLKSGYLLPSVAAAAMVVTATGATVTQSAPLDLHVTGAASSAKANDAAAFRMSRLESQQQRSAQADAARSRVVQAQQVARAAERRALAAKSAKAAAAKKAAAERKARETWVMPIKGAVFTSGFGWRWGRMHEGDDFGTPVGTPLAAMSTGKVTFAGWEGGYGNKIEITYWDGTVSVFGHLSQIATSVGQAVAPGDIVGYSGNTGHSTGPHLHLEIHPGGGNAIDPAPWLHSHGLQ
jgi:murein DD-endopeptidase MepM/ murein hydrolase activator NlpD